MDERKDVVPANTWGRRPPIVPRNSQKPARLPGIVLLVPPIVLCIPILQHISTQIALLQSGVVVHWGDADEVVGSFGVLRYSKDIVGLILLVLGAGKIVRSKDAVVRGLSQQCVPIVGGLFFMGLFGHMLDPQPFLLVVGLRWLVHSSAAVVLCLLIIEYRLWDDPRFRRLLSIAVVVALSGNALFIFFQEQVEAGYARYTGLFSNAGVMGFYVIGLVLALELVLGNSIILCNLAYAAALYSAMRSGSRAAMIIVAFLWVIFLIRKVAGKNNVLLLFSIPIVIYGAWFSFSFAEKTADRGSTIGEQFNEGGRVANIIEFTKTFSDVSVVDLIIGKGFGYGTNGAFGYTTTVETKHPWLTLIDNGYITWFMQFGAVGILVMIGLLIWWVDLFISRIRSAPQTTSIIIGCMLTPILLMLVGNILEQFGLLAFLAVCASWVLSPSAPIFPAMVGRHHYVLRK